MPPKNQTTENRRWHPRFIVQNVRGTMFAASRVEIVNMSISGLAIKVDRRLNIGQEYTLRLDTDKKLISIKGQIVWSGLSEIRRQRGEDDVAIYSVGLKFTELMTQRFLELLEFIDEHKIVGEGRLGGIRFRIDPPGKVMLDVPQSYNVRLISLSGMLIETDRKLDIDEVYPMEAALGDAAIRFSGRVAYCEEKQDRNPRHYEIGIAFLEMGPEEQARLSDFIDSLKG